MKARDRQGWRETPEGSQLLQRLDTPEGNVRAVLDTDTYNEIDDQYALAYAVLASGMPPGGSSRAGRSFELQAVYAAPFHNERSSGPGDGMEKSYAEIQRVLDRLSGHRLPDRVLRGSRRFLATAGRPEQSEAASDLIARAATGTGSGPTAGRGPGAPLYVLAIGAPTNVASALLLEPGLRERVVVVWLGGQPLYWHTASDFNLKQDLLASRTLLDSGVPLIHIPCKNVAEHLRVTLPELEQRLGGRSPLCDYLLRITREWMAAHGALSKVIWDIATVAWLRNPEWVPSHLVHSPILTSELTWSRDGARHLIRQAVDVQRDAVFGDLYGLLADA
jgi:purine nucleosidase